MALASVVEALLDPACYPERPASVTLAQTHISSVLLAGDDVYKIKKPVRFSFLDFSTLERRRHFCREEVRLNRRLADDMYKGVVAIVKDGAGYRFADEDDPKAIEYAVHMRRLPESRMLDRLLEQGAVTAAMIDRIAARLAEFHAQADSGPEVAADGAPAAIEAIVRDNFAGTRPFRDKTIAAADDDDIQAFMLGFLRTQRALFERRQREGRIRDGHGDLHADHVCFDGERLLIYDCIEFNPHYRRCDVASDLAFLVMDLEYHGHPELAAQLAGRYAELAQDGDLSRLLPFYRCHRAYVRGKVDSLKSVEEDVGAAERQAARDSARRHFALAYRYTWAASPCLVVFTGLSGTGKSTVAAELARRTGFAHVNSDTIRKQLAGVPLRARPRDHGVDLYTAELSRRTYEAMFDRAQGALAEGRGAILDGTFQRRADRDAARAVARPRRGPILFVECRASDEEIAARLQTRRERGADASDADWAVYVEQKKRYEPYAADEVGERLVIGAGLSAAENSRRVEDELRRRARRAERRGAFRRG